MFDNQIYRRNFGTAMGSSLSPIIAVDIVMQELENMVLKSISLPIPIYHRFVDDIVMAVPINISISILNAFNKFHSRLQFTLKVGGNRINFLDTTIILDYIRLY